MGTEPPVRSRRRLLLLTAATMALAGACAAPLDIGDGASAEAPPAPAPATVEATPAGHDAPRADVALCTVLPQRIVGELTGAGSVDAVGEGQHCTWRLAAPSPAGSSGGDLASYGTLQGTFLDARAFDAGRPAVDDHAIATVDELTSVGDEAFVVRLDEPGPTTLYVRDGQRALSLWLDDVAMTPEATEQSLARTATLLLRLA
jgi:hypothetical protein